jgi:hypothetical protein
MSFSAILSADSAARMAPALASSGVEEVTPRPCSKHQRARTVCRTLKREAAMSRPARWPGDLARDPLEGGRNQIAIVVTIPNVYLSSQ